LNKSTKSRIEKERHRQEYDDVDQITPPPRSATSFGVAFCHSLEIIISAENRKTNRTSPISQWLKFRESDLFAWATVCDRPSKT